MSTIITWRNYQIRDIMLQTAFPGCELTVSQNEKVVHICLICCFQKKYATEGGKVEAPDTTFNIETSTRAAVIG